MLTLRRLFLYTTLACFSAAAFALPTVTVASSVYTLSLIVLSVQMVASFVRDHERRSYHIGFAVTCALYLWIAMGSRNGDNNYLLLTQRLFYGLEGFFPLHESGFPPPPSIGERYQMPSESSFRTEHLLAIWHSTWSVVVGEVAGLISYGVTRHRIKSA